MARVWTQSEIDTLKEMAKTTGPDAVASAVGRTRNSVWIKSKQLGISFHGIRRKWTAKDDNHLIYLAGTMTYNEVAKEMGKSVSSVKIRASKLGIKVRDTQVTLTEVATILGINLCTAWKLRNKLKIKSRRYKGDGTAQGLTESDIVLMAKHLMQSRGNVRTPAKQLLQVIEDYSL